MNSNIERIYSNNGNRPLIELLSSNCRRILDIGCGSGDNAALIRTANPKCEVYGITHSPAEAELARNVMTRCWVFDIEDPLPKEVDFPSFDALIFSHVLEHMREPAIVLKRFVTLLRSGGEVLIAVPNVLSWRMRVQFVLGEFQYGPHGVLDDTHLRFFTYFTADRYLLANSDNLRLVCKKVSGGVPLWRLRRNVLPSRLIERIDAWGTTNWPNLFGGQVLIQALKV